MIINKANAHQVSRILASAFLGDSFYISSDPSIKSGTDVIECVGVSSDEEHLIFKIKTMAMQFGVDEDGVQNCEQLMSTSTWTTDTTGNEFHDRNYRSKIGPAYIALRSLSVFNGDGEHEETSASGYLAISKTPNNFTLLNQDYSALEAIAKSATPLNKYHIDFNQDFRLDSDLFYDPNVNMLAKGARSEDVDYIRGIDFPEFILLNNKTMESTSNAAFLSFAKSMKLLDIDYNPYKKTKEGNKSFLDAMYLRTFEVNYTTKFDVSVKHYIKSLSDMYPPVEQDDIVKLIHTFIYHNKYIKIGMDTQLHEMLKRMGVDQSYVFDQGKTVAHIAIGALKPGAESNVSSIIQQMKFDMNKQDANGDTAAHCLTQNNPYLSLGIFHAILNAGADLSIKNNNGKTALDHAKETLWLIEHPEHEQHISTATSQTEQLREFIKAMEQSLNSTIANDTIEQARITSPRKNRPHI